MGRNPITRPAVKKRKDMRRNSHALDTGSGRAVTIGDIRSLEWFQAHPNGTTWLIISWSAFQNRVNN